MVGAGSNLHDLIKAWSGEDFTADCSCRAWLRKMDNNLPWARANVDLITAKLMKEATKRALAWRAVPVDKRGTLLNAVVHANWKGAYFLPGAGLAMPVFVHGMVVKSIEMAGG